MDGRLWVSFVEAAEVGLYNRLEFIALVSRCFMIYGQSFTVLAYGCVVRARTSISPWGTVDYSYAIRGCR